MFAHWVLQLDRYNPSEGTWAKVDAQGELVVGPHQGPLTLAATNIADDDLWVLIPTEEVTLDRVKVPAKQKKQAHKAIPFVMEESLASDIDDCHFAIGEKDDEGCYPVCVVPHEIMQTLLATLSENGLSPQCVIPDVFGLPIAPEAWSILGMGDKCVVRTNRYQGFGSDSDWVNIALEQEYLALGESSRPKQWLTYGVEQTVLQGLAKQFSEVDVKSTKHPENDFLYLLKHLAKESYVNLCQGPYEKRQNPKEIWSQWRLPAALAVGVLLFSFVGTFIENQYLSHQSESLQQKIEDLYRDTFPEDRRIVNVKVQMQNNIKALKQSGTGQFLPLLSQFGEAIQSNDNIRLISTRYTRQLGHLEVEVETKGFPVFESLKKDLEKTLNVDVKTANISQGDWVRGSLRLKGKQS